MAGEPKLCYVDPPWAWFTTLDLDKQWGDDWNDAPYEHNAGPPYEWGEFEQKRGVEPWEIVRVAFEGEFFTPEGDCSVERINSGLGPWLTSGRANGGAVYPGCGLSEFREWVVRCGGAVYERVGVR